MLSLLLVLLLTLLFPLLPLEHAPRLASAVVLLPPTTSYSLLLMLSQLRSLIVWSCCLSTNSAEKNGSGQPKACVEGEASTAVCVMAHFGDAFP